MRIIAGELRGRRIQAPEGLGTRPMLDRVRESVFDTLSDWMSEAVVLDLFAGSGSLGLEALSRGARAARLVERHTATVELLRQNVVELGLEGRAEVVRGNALTPAVWHGGKHVGESRYDLIFLDPPYPLVQDRRSRDLVLERARALVLGFLQPHGRLVFHVPRGALNGPELGAGVLAELREYGTNALWYLHADPRRGGSA